VKARVFKRRGMWHVAAGSFPDRYTDVTCGSWEDAMAMATNDPERLFDIGVLKALKKMMESEA
jgi:hypothetical protein